jgi:hypothetical protein
MKRQRSPASTRKRVLPLVERDEASGAASRAPPEQRYANLKMPHERDEVSHRPGPPGPVTTQAANDLRDGQRDTDRYTQAGEDFDRKGRGS